MHPSATAPGTVITAEEAERLAAELIARAERGESFLIRDGKTIFARLSPPPTARAGRAASRRKKKQRRYPGRR